MAAEYIVSQPYQTEKESCETVAERYFKAFNENRFIAAAELFAADGELRPPFDSAIVGRTAIAEYLEQEASQMTAYPDSMDRLENGYLQVIGKVDAIAFKVGVEWTFAFTDDMAIESLSIRLRASMRELLTLRPSTNED